ncbi:MAG: hypothetical protein VX975_02725, partial [Acidobacteriota bacterium]|nr:hypothetical protein [Acidobacteriota bacterium]
PGGGQASYCTVGGKGESCKGKWRLIGLAHQSLGIPADGRQFQRLGLPGSRGFLEPIDPLTAEP